MRYLILVLLLCGCGAAPVVSGFETQLAQFQMEAVRHSLDGTFHGSIRLESVPEGATGYCHTSGNIGIKPENWTLNSDHIREAIVFHELGHCVFGMKHSTSRLMSPVIDYQDYYLHRSEVLQEFFQSVQAAKL